jgi:Ca2+-binding RTX toxin-like protein
MTRRLITAVAVVTVFAAATAYAAVTPIPPDQYPEGCHPDGEALQGNNAADLMEGTSRRDLLRGGNGIDSIFGSVDADCLFGETGAFDYIDGGPGGTRSAAGRG